MHGSFPHCCHCIASDRKLGRCGTRLKYKVMWWIGTLLATQHRTLTWKPNTQSLSSKHTHTTIQYLRSVLSWDFMDKVAFIRFISPLPPSLRILLWLFLLPNNHQRRLTNIRACKEIVKSLLMPIKSTQPLFPRLLCNQQWGKWGGHTCTWKWYCNNQHMHVVRLDVNCFLWLVYVFHFLKLNISGAKILKLGQSITWLLYWSVESQSNLSWS